MTRTALFFVVLATAAPGRALWFNGGLKQTAGSGDYYGTTLSATVGHDDFSLRPEYSTYRSNASAGVYRAASMRGAYDAKKFGLGASAGGSNKIDGYSNRWFGVDATLSLTPSSRGPEKRISGKGEAAGPARGKGLLRVDVGGEFRHTRHVDEFSAEPGTRRAVVRRLTGRSLTIGQSDMTASLGVSLFNNLLSLDATKSKYDRDIRTNNARAASFARLRGVGAMVQGFPDTSYTGRFETSLLPIVTPFAQYTRTRFVVGQPDSHATSFGGNVELGIVQISVSYETYIQRGAQTQNYVSAGGSLRF